MRRIIYVFAYDLRPGDIVLDDLDNEVEILDKRIYEDTPGMVFLKITQVRDEPIDLYVPPIEQFKMVLK